MFMSTYTQNICSHSEDSASDFLGFSLSDSESASIFLRLIKIYPLTI